MSPDHDRRRVEAIALTSLGAAVLLIGVKLAAALASGSLALLSEAAHSAFDAAATLLTFIAVRIAGRPPDEDHPYGHGKAENIAALLETGGLLVLAGFIAAEAAQRLRGGGAEVEATWYAFAVIGLSMVVDASRARVLRRAGRKYRSPALQADALHFTADLLTSTIVGVGLLAVRAGYPAADALGGILIAAYVAFQSIRLGRRSVDVLMERAPPDLAKTIEDAAAGVAGVQEVRRVRARYVGGKPEADVVIAVSRTSPLESAHSVTEEVEAAVERAAPEAEVVVHVEPIADEKAVSETVLALAARDPEVHELHNVYVEQHPDGFHISFHAKFPPSMMLADAHAIAERLEREVAREIPGVARVDSHLEPLSPISIEGEDVSARRPDLVAAARLVAESQHEVRNCHEVLVTESPAGAMSLVMHCVAAPGISISAVHDASTRIETVLHDDWPEVERVTVHFEPAGAGA